MRKITQEKGKCICESENINYLETEFFGESLGYSFKCEDCGRVCIEWYDLTYSETTER